MFVLKLRERSHSFSTANFDPNMGVEEVVELFELFELFEVLKEPVFGAGTEPEAIELLSECVKYPGKARAEKPALGKA